jgi:hypothetical protein
MKIRDRLTLVVAVGVAVAMAIATAPASVAQPATSSVSVFGPGGARPLVNSTYLAGYQITEPGIDHASVTFVVPTLTCPATDAGTVIGLGNEAVVGNSTLLAVVFLMCLGGPPVYSFTTQAGGNSGFGTAAAGDVIIVSVTQGRGKVTAVVRDKTNATGATASGPPTPDNTMLFGDFPVFTEVGMLPVADFGSVIFRSPYLENTKLMVWSPTKLNRKTGATIEISTSNFNAAGNFRLTYLNP